MAFPKNYYRTLTISIASPAVFTLTEHDLYTNDEVIFSTTGALPTGLTANTSYYVIREGLTRDVFRVSAEKTENGTGAVVNTSGTQSGTQTFLKINSSGLRPYVADTR
jgi:hypothetical protein